MFDVIVESFGLGVCLDVELVECVFECVFVFCQFVVCFGQIDEVEFVQQFQVIVEYGWGSFVVYSVESVEVQWFVLQFLQDVQSLVLFESIEQYYEWLFVG